VVCDIERFRIESKWCEELSLYKAMGQAVSEARDGQIPLVVHKRNRREPLLVMRFEDALTFARELVKAAAGLP
jgi:hypothetical protein